MKTILVIVTGSRKEFDPDRISKGIRSATLLALEILPTTREAHKVLIYHGLAAGADQTADRVARANGFEVETFAANWDRHGKGAGPIRNQEMVDTALAVLAARKVSAVACAAFPCPQSIGTWDCAKRAHKAGFPVYVAP